MSLNDDKIKQMQDEMSRFEEEIGLPIPEVLSGGAGPRIIGANTYHEAQKTLAGIPGPGDVRLPTVLPPPPPPPPLPFVPPQVRSLSSMEASRMPLDPGMAFNGGLFRGPLPPPPPMPPHLGPGSMPPQMPQGPMPPGFGMMPPMGPGSMPPQMMQVPPNFPGPGARVFQQMTAPSFVPPAPPPVEPKPSQPATTVLSATPMMYVSNPQMEMVAMQAEISQQQQSVPVETSTVSEESKKPQIQKKKTAQPAVETSFIPMQIQNPSKKKEKKNKKLIRVAGGQTWEDPTLAEWEDDDFRLFCGDLGNDVTDEVLTRAFSKYPSFVKARVIRDKRTNKTKGFGFVSFKDPQDFIRATKEMNGRYVGSRPIKLRKSSWKNRSLDVVRKKDKEKTMLIQMLTGR